MYAVRPDGSGQRRVAQGDYAWPSQADDGTIVAVDAAGTLHRMTPQGAPIGGLLPSQATNASEEDAVEAPTHVRISPDGKRIAYDIRTAGAATTLWTPADATGLDFPGQDAGQEELVAPSWIGSDRLLLSRRARQAHAERGRRAPPAPRHRAGPRRARARDVQRRVRAGAASVSHVIRPH